MKYLSLVTAILLSAFVLAQADLLELNINAYGHIESGDTVKARAAAFKDVIRQALEKGIREYVPESTVNAKRQVIDNNIFTKAAGYIRRLEIIDEKAGDDKPDYYEIKATITIYKDELRKDLVDLGVIEIEKDSDLPPVLIFIQEKNIDDVHWHFKNKSFNYAESTISDVLSAKEFRIIDRNELYKDLTPDVERAFYADDLNAILKIGSRHKAGLILVGKAISRASLDISARGSNVLIQASVNLEAIQANNGKTIASSSGIAELGHADELTGGSLAIKKATRTAAQKLLADLANSRTGNIVTGIKITLIVNGLKSIEDLIEFRKDFESYYGPFRNFERRTFAGGTAAFDLVANSDGMIIASMLAGRGLKAFDLEIRAKSPDYLELNLKPR